MPQVMGSGVALLDIDNDGRPDILFLNNAGPAQRSSRCIASKLDGTFSRCLRRLRPRPRSYGMGVAVGDLTTMALSTFTFRNMAAVSCSATRGTALRRRHGRSRRHLAALEHFGGIPRLRPRWLARPHRRQLRRLRSLAFLCRTFRARRLLSSTTIPGNGRQALPK